MNEIFVTLFSLTKDITKTLELYEVIQGEKPVARQAYRQWQTIKMFLEQHHLHVVVSPLAVALVDITDQHQGYSNKGILVTPSDTANDTPQLRFLYISKDLLLAHKALLAELQQKDEALGKLLGYPSCCIAFFQKHKEEKAKTDFNYTDKIAEASEEGTYPFFQNYFLPEKLVSHFPCCMHCEASKNQAKKRWKMLTTFFPQEAVWIKKQLQKSIVMSKKTFSFGEENL